MEQVQPVNENESVNGQDHPAMSEQTGETPQVEVVAMSVTDEPPQMTEESLEKQKAETVMPEVIELPKSNEEKLLDYLEGKSQVRINDFLKSLFPLPKMGEPDQSITTGANAYLRGFLENLVQQGKITIVENRHQQLGNFYYLSNDDPRTQYHNLKTVPIVATKVG